MDYAQLNWTCEASVQELLSDPIVHLLLRHDGIKTENVWAAVRGAQSRLRANPIEVEFEIP